jgi:Uma2 family endonuclease
MARNTPHDTALQKTEKAIREVLPTGWDLRGQMAITTADSEPEPDCAIVRGEADDYLAAHPTSGDIAFLVEVADSSLADDRDWKARIYGRAAIPIYWIVNVPDRQLEIFTEPTGVTDPPDAAGYRLRRIYKDTETVPVEIGGSVVAQLQVPRLLPRN